MKKLYALAAALFVGATAFAQSYSVTFQVDLGSATASTNGVHVAGSFQGWQPDTTAMTQVGTSTIYSVTRQLSAGKHEFKFVNGNAWGSDESVPASIALNNNRWVVVSSDTTLPAVQYAGAAPAGQKAIHFKVDMSMQTVSADSVHVAGSFQGWDPAKTQMVNAGGMYRYIAYVNASDSVYFKFVNGNGWGAVEGVPSACQAQSVGISQGDNRYYTDAVSGVYEVCYAQCGPCVVLPTYDLTINVDMNSIEACQAVSAVTLAGPINSWSGSDTLTDSDGDGVYSITFNDVDSGDFVFKARWHDASGATNWEGGGNKVIMVSNDTVAPARCFGNDVYGACATVPATADVTFIVDFTQAAYTPADTIYLIGTFTQWDANNAIAMTQHTVPGQYITTLSSFCPGTMEYRFSNGDPANTANHEPVDAACGVDNGVGSYNRFFARTGANDTLRHTYATCSFVTVEEDVFANLEIRPNPMTSGAVLDLGMADVFNVQVMDMTGRVVASFNNVNGEVALNRGTMVNGLYFVAVANSQGEVRTHKLMVK